MNFNRALLFVAIAVLSVSCKRSSQKTDTADNHTDSASVADAAIILKTKDTIPSGKDTISIRSAGFDINGLNCYWSYTVVKESRADNPAYNARIVAMELRLSENDRNLLKPGISYDLQNEFYSINDLKQNPQAVLACKDINHDTWCDYEVLFERAAAGANTSTDAFLFNPNKKQFEHSKLFSGTNMEYDTVKNMIKTFWKMSVDNYTYTYTYLKPNKREISYIIEETIDGDKVTVKKIVNGKIVKTSKAKEQ